MRPSSFFCGRDIFKPFPASHCPSVFRTIVDLFSGRGFQTLDLSGSPLPLSFVFLSCRPPNFLDSHVNLQVDRKAPDFTVVFVSRHSRLCSNLANRFCLSKTFSLLAWLGVRFSRNYLFLLSLDELFHFGVKVG